jgi:hypothetical protein
MVFMFPRSFSLIFNQILTWHIHNKKYQNLSQETYINSHLKYLQTNERSDECLLSKKQKSKICAIKVASYQFQRLNDIKVMEKNVKIHQ